MVGSRGPFMCLWPGARCLVSITQAVKTAVKCLLRMWRSTEKFEKDEYLPGKVLSCIMGSVVSSVFVSWPLQGTNSEDILLRPTIMEVLH